jgi:phytanoyl-CoA hydroxylase
MDTPLQARDDDAYFTASQATAARAYYEEHGYVVLRGVVPAEQCARVSAFFDEQIKPYDDFIYRQTTGNPEKHSLSARGHMMNPILNVQDLPQSSFGQFRAAALDVIAGESIHQVLKAFFGEPARLVQSMFFEGNPITPAHQDTYYLDSTAVGRMVAVWFAIEDIAPGAGRFYVYPGSHRIALPKPSGDTSYSYHHDQYKAVVLKVIEDSALECRAPALAAGDVLLWHPSTIHGSLSTTSPEASRRSFTGHYIPASTGLLQFRSRDKKLKLRPVNGMDVNHPKSRDRLINKLIFLAETRAPKQFRALKRLAIRILVG